MFAKKKAILTLIVMVSIFLIYNTWGPAAGPSALPQSNNAQIAAMAKDREAFELAANGDQSEQVMQRLRKCGVLSVYKEGNCIKFWWPFTHCLAAIPAIYYAPNGRDDLPNQFWDSGLHLWPMQVDNHWFVFHTP